MKLNGVKFLWGGVDISVIGCEQTGASCGAEAGWAALLGQGTRARLVHLTFAPIISYLEEHNSPA